MAKPISIAVRDLKLQIVAAINASQLPAAIVEPILNVIHNQITQIAENEIKQAEKQLAESEESE